MAYKFKLKARPKSRRPRFGGSGSPSKRTRGGSMSRLRKKSEPKETQSLSRGAKSAGKIASSLGKQITESAMKAIRKAKNLEEGYDEDGLIEGAGGWGLGATKKFKSKEERKKAEDEAEANVNRRRTAKKKAAKKRAQEKVASNKGSTVRNSLFGKPKY